jgi:FAD-dependent halogenase
MNIQNHAYDVIVIGGGPAGACTAGHLSRKGWRVLVVEGKKFPRHHIGESLLAMSIPLLRDLGVESKLHQAGFLRKTGAIFIWGSSEQPITLDMPPPGYAFQVSRAQFDQLLLDHAQEQGTEVYYDHWIRQLIQGPDGRVAGVVVETPDRQEIRLSCRYLVDASGLAQFLPRRLNLPITVDGPRRIAISGYFTNAERPEAPRTNDIISEACRDGWLWFIPLSDKLTSVGFVGDEMPLARRPQELLAEQLATSKLVRSMLSTATPAQEAAVLRYTNHLVDAPLWGPGYVLVGDTAMFVDPLFSTGVHGALYSASLVAACLCSVLKGTAPEFVAATWYDQRVKHHYHRVNEMIKLLYGLHEGNSMFWRSRHITDLSEEAAEQLAQTLNAIGMAFFAGTAQEGMLTLPTALSRRLPEFVAQIGRPAAVPLNTIVERVPEVTLEEGWMRSQGELVAALSLTHARGRTLRIEHPANSAWGQILRATDGQRSIAEITQSIAQVQPNLQLPTPTRIALFIGTLLQAGLLRQMTPYAALTSAT